ncbi:hypothetical protein NDU88_006497 [Pleurodeles waltl]|uniref:Uncharacterized protein n=1 Tax=Pleurodeles waltl TaxID=8319 RepID=A0AAV7LPA2_PLEWA|nr:hypothetical protein NDU88_006497 [Pleurodeles waltl]
MRGRPGPCGGYPERPPWTARARRRFCPAAPRSLVELNKVLGASAHYSSAMGGHSGCLRSRLVRVGRDGAQPGREHPGPESLSAAAVRRVARRWALRKAQRRSVSSAAGDEARASALQRRGSRDVSPPDHRCTSASRGPL